MQGKKKSFIALLFFMNIYFYLNAANVVIAESAQSSATERNNARLIVEDSSGVLHVVYYNNGIYYSFSNDNGQSWSFPPFMITDVGRNPSLALDNNNVVHLVYKKGGTVAYDIVHRTYNGSWSEEDTVYHDSGTKVSRPVIAVDIDNNLHCVWQRAGYSSTPNSEIWYNKYTVGSGWSLTPINISNTYGSSEYPTLTIDNENNIYAFWKDSGENINNDKMVLFRKYTVGIGWDANYTNVSNTTGNGGYATMDPCAITDSENNVHLVWKDSESGTSEIYYKKYSNGIWDTLSTNISELPAASGRPSISVDNNDNLFVAWENKTGGVYYDIVYKMFDKISNTWSELQNISSTNQCDSRHPCCPIKKGDYFHTIWTEGGALPYSIMINSFYLVDLAQNGLTNKIDYHLEQNYPNPFNPQTTIKYKLPANSRVTLKIYNLLGEEIRTLVNEKKTAGYHSVIWDGTNNSGFQVSSGIYFYKLQVGENFSGTKRMLLLK